MICIIYHIIRGTYREDRASLFLPLKFHYWQKIALVILQLHISTQNFAKFHFFTVNKIVLSRLPKDQYAHIIVCHWIIYILYTKGIRVHPSPVTPWWNIYQGVRMNSLHILSLCLCDYFHKFLKVWAHEFS